MKNTEIERKYLIDTNIWKPKDRGLAIRQGYLTADGVRTVRVRTKGANGYLTIKGKTTGISRLEMEYEIPYDDATRLLNELCAGPLIEKTRYLEEYAGHTWEIDVFFGENQGLVMAECELQSEDEAVALPKWVVKEVSGDGRYYNSSLTRFPYSKWNKLKQK